MITTKESGVEYNEITQAVIDFHSDNGLTISYVARPLSYDQHGNYIDDITAAEIEAGKDAVKKFLYREESDPLFFKYQRGEITEQDWSDKVNEIKAKVP